MLSLRESHASSFYDRKANLVDEDTEKCLRVCFYEELALSIRVQKHSLGEKIFGGNKKTDKEAYYLAELKIEDRLIKLWFSELSLKRLHINDQMILDALNKKELPSLLLSQAYKVWMIYKTFREISETNEYFKNSQIFRLVVKAFKDQHVSHGFVFENKYLLGSNYYFHSRMGGPTLRKRVLSTEDVIHEGSFGQVMSVGEDHEGRSFVVKTFNAYLIPRKKLPEFTQSYVNEIEKLRDVHLHKKVSTIQDPVLPLYSIPEVGEKKKVVGYIGKRVVCDLVDLIVGESDKVTVEMIYALTKQMFEALIHLKAISMYHFDIRRENIYYLGNNQFQLGDFGNAKNLNELFAGSELHQKLRTWEKLSVEEHRTISYAIKKIENTKTKALLASYELYSMAKVILSVMKRTPIEDFALKNLLLEVTSCNFTKRPTVEDINVRLDEIMQKKSAV